MKLNKINLFLVGAALCNSTFAQTDVTMPYIGTQTSTKSDAYNNGSIQDTERWGKGVTDVMGGSFGYVTPTNDSQKGGLWAGNKAAAVTYGGTDTGVFVDKEGVKIKKSDLDVTGNAIKNVKDGVDNNDAVNVSQLNNNATETLKTANGYADDKATQTLKTANGYADDKATQTLKTANGYADDKATQTLKTANGYTDDKTTRTLGAANAYTDRRIQKLENNVNKGMASAAALSGLFQPYGVGKFNFSAGVGGYKGETSIAVGSGYRFSENVATKMGVATSAGGMSSTMYNASVNFEW
ncbi:YadA-like family protein [Serratia sp. 1D1416]|uniref:YadA-like family protein n=1 Tax=Serratia sp. 1D1416 TaxID=2447890 RepID=UPI001013C99F|nr:YadA-like family protein [Serratia sp. 1D1416]